MSEVVTIKQAEIITGRDRSYWQTGKGRKWTIKDEDGNIWVFLTKFNQHIEAIWQQTPALENPAKAASKSGLCTVANATLKKSNSSPTLKDFVPPKTLEPK